MNIRKIFKKLGVILLAGTILLSAENVMAATSTATIAPRTTSPSITTAASVQAFTPTVMAKLSDQQKAYVLQWYQLALEESVGHNVPWQIAMAQGILESGSGTTDNAVKNHNHHGIKGEGWNGYQYFATDAEGWEGYFENIDRTKVYSRNGAHEAVDPLEYIDVLWLSGYAEDPDYKQKLIGIYEGIEEYRLEMGLLTTAEYAESLEEEAHAAWPAKEQKLIQAELNRLYPEKIDNLVGSGKLYAGKAGITNMNGIILDVAYHDFVEPYHIGLATISDAGADVG